MNCRKECAVGALALYLSFLFCCQKSEEKRKADEHLSNTLVLFKSSRVGLSRSSVPMLFVANNWLSSAVTWAISDAILYLQWTSSSPEKWLIHWGTDGEEIVMAKMKEISIYHYSFCKCRHCLFMQWALIPSIHFSSGIQQGELEWTCHLVLPPTHPKGQLCFPAGSSGLLPWAGCVPCSALAADRPTEAVAMMTCSGMKFLLHLEPAHWWACCWCFLVLIAALTFPVGFSSFNDTYASFWRGFVVYRYPGGFQWSLK